jgi:hypothetical protein
VIDANRGAPTRFGLPPRKGTPASQLEIKQQAGRRDRKERNDQHHRVNVQLPLLNGSILFVIS